MVWALELTVIMALAGRITAFSHHVTPTFGRRLLLSSLSSPSSSRCSTRPVMSGLPTVFRGIVRRNMSSDYGTDMDQDAMMETDMLIAVDSNDVLIPGAQLSKRDGHTFNKDSPRATLHRAFSFFLFDSEGKMLLTKRAASKMTFPNVWTNTCCSHPLYGMKPDEVDITPSAYPSFPGIKHAAIRKSKHELGIDPSYIDHDKIQFISRFHYWASDTITYGKEDTPWGEHEVDYILFMQTGNQVPVKANPDEVAEHKYVSIDELRAMRKEPGLLWSPWFLGIMDRGGWDWWADLEGSLAGKNTNDNVIFFDPPAEHVANYNLESHTRETGVLLSVGNGPQ
jgi:isopentenyl-diphosphate delta-isomerase type 1